MKFLDFTKLFEVHIDASDFTINKVFMQDGHPIAFENKKLYGAQLQWLTHDKELYIVVCCVKTWQHYLGMHEKKVFVDNFFLNILKPNQGPQRNS